MRGARSGGCVRLAAMRQIALTLCAIAAFAGVIAGCGGERTAAPLPNTVVGSVPQPTATTPSVPVRPGNATAGKAVFTSAGCIGCHTLSAAGATGTVGPNLDQAKPALERIFDRVTNGKGAMPSFKGRLTDTQIADVAAFVYKSTHGG